MFRAGDKVRLRWDLVIGNDYFPAQSEGFFSHYYAGTSLCVVLLDKQYDKGWLGNRHNPVPNSRYIKTPAIQVEAHALVAKPYEGINRRVQWADCAWQP